MKKLIALCVSLISLIPTIGLSNNRIAAAWDQAAAAETYDDMLRSLNEIKKPDETGQNLNWFFPACKSIQQFRNGELPENALKDFMQAADRAYAALRVDMDVPQSMKERLAKELAISKGIMRARFGNDQEEKGAGIKKARAEIMSSTTAFWVLGGIAGVGAVYWVAKKFDWFKKEAQKPKPVHKSRIA
jgi:hypothetical protein